jgi:multidrug resistance efflux pump
MPTPFARLLRSLESDGFRGVTFAFVCAAALCAAWGTWFVVGRVTVYEVTDAARLEVADSAHPIDARVAGRVVATPYYPRIQPRPGKLDGWSTP